MSAIVHPAFEKEYESIENIISFQNGNMANYFYQQINVPFMIAVMAIHPEDMDHNAFTLFTPESQFNIPIHKALSGRGKQTMHQHNIFEFTYILKGKMYQYVEGKRYLYLPGSCCLMNRDTLHTEEIDTDFVCIFFSISADFIKRLNNYGNTMLFPHEQSKCENQILQFLLGNIQEYHKSTKDFLDFVPLITESQQKELIHNIFESMIKTILFPEYGATYHLQYLFLRLIDILCDSHYYHITHVKTTGSSDSLLFARINQLLEEYHGRISNQQLSQFLNYNGTYLGKIVKNYTGKNLFQYRLSFTMKEAANLLQNTDYCISEIADKLNFSNRAHFYKLFKEYYGMTPKEYRQNT